MLTEIICWAFFCLASVVLRETGASESDIGNEIPPRQSRNPARSLPGDQLTCLNTDPEFTEPV
jgi:hypothetical protein